MIEKTKKSKGRPVTGSAKSAAERQAAYRRNKKTQTDGQENLNVWISTNAKKRLKELSTANGITPGEMLEKLLAG